MWACLGVEDPARQARQALLEVLEAGSASKSSTRSPPPAASNCLTDSSSERAASSPRDELLGIARLVRPHAGKVVAARRHADRLAMAARGSRQWRRVLLGLRIHDRFERRRQVGPRAPQAERKARLDRDPRRRQAAAERGRQRQLHRPHPRAGPRPTPSARRRPRRPGAARARQRRGTPKRSAKRSSVPDWRP